VAEDRFEPRPERVRLLKRIISNNSYAHDDQVDNPGQENRELDGVLYKLWPFVSDIAIFVLKKGRWAYKYVEAGGGQSLLSWVHNKLYNF